ncbi:hypothetical protein [Paenibacillus medicaginis]|uniref:Uncharacterized protein n=1 Tax=Paenibacillus medicaginis TaxID=1470560 RepID=A0ABV5BZ19_9BACL
MDESRQDGMNYAPYGKCHDFYTHIREEKKFWLDGDTGIKSFRLFKQIYEASRTARV